MSRLALLPFALLTLLPACARPAAEPVTQPSVAAAAEEVPVAPMPRAVVAVAPMPHLPGEAVEIDLTNQDIGLPDVVVEVERIPELVLPEPPGPAAPLALPAPPGPQDLTLLPGVLVPAFDEPKGKDAELKGVYSGRSGAAKARLLKEYGGNAESEKAVALGLAWLARQQKKDGSWEFDGSSKTHKAAATGLAVLAFLGAGETHKLPKGKYQKTVKAGLDWLRQATPTGGTNPGRVSTDAYTQGIATLALCEAYALTKDPALRPAAQAAANFTQKAQGNNGSWGYSAGSAGDTSITGWQLQALFAAKQGKLVVDERVLKKAVKFLDSASKGERKAAYGYNNNAAAAPGTALTAVGLWSRHCFDDWAPDHAGLKEGAEGLVKRPPVKNRFDTYYLHYATMVVKARGGEEWATWNEGPKAADGTRKGGLRDVLVELQDRKDGANLGSWAPDQAHIGLHCGRVGTTALCVLNLQAYYRHAPLYKEDGSKVEPPK